MFKTWIFETLVRVVFLSCNVRPSVASWFLVANYGSVLPQSVGLCKIKYTNLYFVVVQFEDAQCFIGRLLVLAEGECW